MSEHTATVSLSYDDAVRLRNELWREMTIEASDLGLRIRDELFLHWAWERWQLGVTEHERALIERVLGREVAA